MMWGSNIYEELIDESCKSNSVHYLATMYDIPIWKFSAFDLKETDVLPLIGYGHHSLIYGINDTCVLRVAGNHYIDSFSHVMGILKKSGDKFSIPKVNIINKRASIVERLIPIKNDASLWIKPMPCNWEVLNSISMTEINSPPNIIRKALYSYFDTVRDKGDDIDTIIEHSIEALLLVNSEECAYRVPLDFNLTNIMVRPSTGEYIINDVFGTLHHRKSIIGA